MGRLILVLLLAALHLSFGAPAWLLPDAGTPYAVRALSYSFFHASWWHLAVNSLAICSVFRRPSGFVSGMLLPFLIAVLVYPLSVRPVIGFSNVLYAALGIRTPALSSPWWRRREVLLFLAVTAAMVFVPRFSATTHVAAFVLGMGCAAARRFHDNLLRDAGRYL